MQRPRTHYDNLMVSRNAPAEVIRAAYKSLTQKYHPDKNPGDPNAVRIMAMINQAYEVLSDPQRRRAHDEWISQQEQTYQQAQLEQFQRQTQPQANQRPPAPPPNTNGTDSLKSKNWIFLTLLAFVIILGIGLYNANQRSGAFYQDRLQGSQSATQSVARPKGSPQSVPAAPTTDPIQTSVQPRPKTDFDYLADAYMAQYAQLNPMSPHFNQPLVDRVNNRTYALIQGGMIDTSALAQAVNETMRAAPEQQSKVQRQSPGQRASANSLCVYKTVMTDEDYRVCGISPPR